VAFVNAYGFAYPARFRRCLPAREGTIIAIGAVGNLGLAARIGSNGDCLWARSYTLAGRVLELIDGVERGEEHLLLATARVAGEVGSLVVFRVDSLGAVNSVPMALDDGADGNARIYHVESPIVGSFVIAGPPKTAEYYGSRAGRILYLGPNDEGVRATNVRLEGGGRLFGGAFDAEGILLVGDAGEQRPLAEWLDAGFEAELDEIGAAALIFEGYWGEDEDSRAWLLSAPAGVPAKLSARAITKRPDGAFLVTGCYALQGKRSTFVAEIVRHGADLAVARAMIIDCSGGHDRPAAIVATAAGSRILVRPEIGTAAARVMHLADDLHPAAMRGFGFPDAFDLLSLDPIATDGIAIAGSTGGKSLLMSVDGAIQCCKAMPLIPPAEQEIVLLLRSVETSTGGRPGSLGLDIVADPVAPDVVWMCGGSIDKWGDRTLVQSPYLLLQAAGSDGTDASRGILLRWFFTGELGKKHFAKGDMASAVAPGGFNRLADDHVILRRAQWPASPPLRTLNFATDKALHLDTTRRILAFQTGQGARKALFHVHFADAAAFFAAVGGSIDALNDPAAFLAAYGPNMIEVELRSVLAVACDLHFQPNGGCAIRLETLSVNETSPLAPKQVSGRHFLQAADGPVRRLVADNIRSLRLECTGTTVGRVDFVCYDDLLSALDAAKAWSELGRFALTDQQNEVFARLEDPARFQVHNHWRKFTNGAMVNVANYHDRWTSVGGLAEAVQTYVQLSDSDPLAVATLPGSDPQDGAMAVSYLDLLGIASLDYHVAQVLGLGYVDSDPVDPSTQYLYLIEYRTEADLGDGKGPGTVQHLFLSQPTRIADARMPMVPDFAPIEYGLEVPTGAGGSYQLTDAQGYTPDGQARYIRLHPLCAPMQTPQTGFFNPPDLFDTSQASVPVCYVIEYRAQGEATWRKPMIANDPDYLDTSSPAAAEAIPSPFPSTAHSQPFVHAETEDGIHEYAPVAINIFFRASAAGAARATDHTTFRRPNRLLPPSDLLVQLIQPEAPLLLTSASEQSALASLMQTSSDATLVRLCFSYGFTQDAAYDFADAVEIFFRPQMPRNVRGGVKAVVPDSDPALIRMETEPYHYASTGEMISPVLLPADRPSYLGGALTAGTHRFVIEDVVWPGGPVGTNPIFVVRRPTMSGVIHTAGTGANLGIDTLTIQDAPIEVSPGDLAMAVENMAAAANWGTVNPLAATVTIGDTSWQERTESFVSNGVPVTRRLRGVWDQATVTQLQPGVFSILFDTYNLAAHPQATASAPVTWWRGTVRVPVANRDPEDRRALKVKTILTNATTATLELIALDDSGEADAPIQGSVLVNYYPSYKIYLGADAAHGFSAATVMPAAGQGSRMTLVGARSRDLTSLDGAGQPYNYRSSMSVPAAIAAVEIIPPGIPDRPTGLAYTTPPDGYANASYSFTTGFGGREPFALVFFRADALSILRALYGTATFDAIKSWLFPIKPDSWFADQMQNLLDYLDTPTMAAPTAFPVDGDSKALPVPDSPALGLNSSISDADARAEMRHAMLRAFVGLTEQPLPYSLIADRTPTDAPQKFRDRNGDLLKPGDEGFDLTPMARKLPDGSVQFVDFTLTGAMGPNTVLFYHCKEINNRMKLGEPSKILGPIALVNLAAPVAPKLRRVTSVSADEATAAPPYVEFELLAPSAIDPIARLRIHRSTDALDALSTRTMPVVADLPLAALTPSADGGLIAADAFASGDPPFGESLFYRFVWVREVPYADMALQPQVADALSEPSRAVLATILDTAAPEAPVPAASVLSVATNGDKMLRLTWSKTMHNGTYHVEQLDRSGSWFKLGAVQNNDPAPQFDLLEALPPKTADGDPIFYQFRITAESSGGRLNLTDAPMTINLATL
jgi:hypothetical protein